MSPPVCVRKRPAHELHLSPSTFASFLTRREPHHHHCCCCAKGAEGKRSTPQRRRGRCHRPIDSLSLSLRSPLSQAAYNQRELLLLLLYCCWPPKIKRHHPRVNMNKAKIAFDETCCSRRYIPKQFHRRSTVAVTHLSRT